jgi:hypothetical protein
LIRLKLLRVCEFTSLDKDASSDPNLKAVHVGASMRKAQHLQPKASDIADAEVGCFAFSRLACPHSSTLQVGGKAHFASKTIIPQASPPLEIHKDP